MKDPEAPHQGTIIAVRCDRFRLFLAFRNLARAGRLERGVSRVARVRRSPINSGGFFSRLFIPPTEIVPVVVAEIQQFLVEAGKQSAKVLNHRKVGTHSSYAHSISVTSSNSSPSALAPTMKSINDALQLRTLCIVPHAAIRTSDASRRHNPCG